jgi:SAM-dependent methyltransferase
LNGHQVTGSTLEFYYDKIQNRLDYWNNFGDLSALNIKYENIFDVPIKEKIYDSVIVQDTLHHLEPINEALHIIHKSLKDDGNAIIIEENGNNIINSLKNFRQRGFKRITEIYDEKLKKKILFGNENTRSFKKWKELFKDSEFELEDDKAEYVRLFPPWYFKEDNYIKLQEREQKIWRQNRFLKEYFFFGINFIARKK